MFIQTQETPNPATISFYPGQTVMEQGTADFRDAKETSDSPLASRLFGIRGVTGVFLGEDFISVTKDDNNAWPLLKPLILGALMDHFTSDEPVMKTQTAGKTAQVAHNDDPLSAQIREVIDTKVQPSVALDGGRIAFDSFKDGIVYVHLQGACAGCPSATVTLKSGVERLLKHYVPEVKEVQAVSGW